MHCDGITAVFRCVETDALSRYAAPHGIPPTLPAAEEADAGIALKKFAAECQGMRVETHLVEDEAPTAILRCARDFHADVLVLGTHGASGLTRLLAGSVAESVLRQATCPVLTVRVPEGAKTEVKPTLAPAGQLAGAPP